jgi:hypothetical protein
MLVKEDTSPAIPAAYAAKPIAAEAMSGMAARCEDLNFEVAGETRYRTVANKRRATESGARVL